MHAKKAPFEPLEAKSLADRVAKAVVDALTSGTFEPGQRLTAAELAYSLGVSVTPVREALRLLEQQGMVTLTANASARLTDVSEDEIREVLRLRQILACEALRQAMQLPPSSSRWGSLREVIKAGRIAVARSDREGMFDVCCRFPPAIYEVAENELLSRYLRQLGARLKLYWSFIRPEADIFRCQPGHERVLDAIERNDEGTAVGILYDLFACKHLSKLPSLVQRSRPSSAEAD